MFIQPTVNEAVAPVETLKAMAQKKHKEIFELKELIKTNKEKLEGRLLDDSTYVSLSKVLENKRKEKNDRKKYLVQNLELQPDIDIIKEQQEELKDAKDGLSAYLKAINEKTHQLTFDDYLGRQRSFTIEAKAGRVLADDEEVNDNE